MCAFLGIVLVSSPGLLPQLTSNLLCVSFWVLGHPDPRRTYDFAATTPTPHCPAGINAGWTSVFNATYDNTRFTFAISDTGGQDTGHLVAVYKTGASGGCRVANVGSTTDGGVPALAIVVAATGCKVVAEWPQTSNPATGTYTDNQATWAPDGAQDARGDVFLVELL